MKVAIFLTLVAVATALPKVSIRKFFGKEIRPSIIGGEDAGEKEFPQFVLLWVYTHWLGYYPYAGGVVYDETRIITSAYSASYIPMNDVIIVAGNNTLTHPTDDPSYGQFRRPVSVILHENYTEDTYDNNIAIVTLDAPLVFTDRVQPVRLAESSFVPSGDVVTCGFGETEDFVIASQLKKETLSVISRDECQHGYDSIDDAPAITESMVCATQPSKSICSGDNGGPLIAKDEAGREILAGIASFGVDPCGGYPSVFANVAHLRPWLESKLDP